MNAGIGPASAIYLHRLIVKYLGGRLNEFSLDGAFIFLKLPSGIPGSVVFEG
jgi:hypothetical protein